MALKWQQKPRDSNQWNNAYLIQTKNEKAIAEFELASFSWSVQVQNFCNVIFTRPIGAWKKISVKYTCTWTC